MKEKKKYIAPELTVVEFKTERGYASSGSELTKVLRIFALAGTLDVSSTQEIWSLDENNTFGSTW